MSRPRSHSAKLEILRVLRSAGIAMTAYKILDAVRPRGISAPIIVYRALKVLVDDGLVHHLASTNSYVACESSLGEHDFVILAICTDCATVEELFDDSILRRLCAHTTERQFMIAINAIEIRGRCASCQRSTPP